MKDETKVIHKGKEIGVVYLSSHGVWVAEPNFSIFSKSFKTKEQAIAALIEKFEEFNS